MYRCSVAIDSNSVVERDMELQPGVPHKKCIARGLGSDTFVHLAISFWWFTFNHLDRLNYINSR